MINQLVFPNNFDKKVIKVKPMGAPRLTKGDKWNKRPRVQRYWEFCDIVRQEWGLEPFPCAVELTFDIPMPKSWSKKKRAQLVGEHHQQTPDLDNLEKAVFDALLSRDEAIHTVYKSKYWSEEGCICITPLPNSDFIPTNLLKIVNL